MQPFASNDTYICPDCGAEVRVGARRCPGCGPFQPISQSDGSEFQSYVGSDEWQEEEPAVLMACMLPMPHQTGRESAGKSRNPRFAIWWMAILLALTLLAGVAAAAKMLRF